MRPETRIRAFAALCLSALTLAFCTGCPVESKLPAPGKVLNLRDPEYGRTYHLYVPSNYKDSRHWPMVVTCHGTHPFDAATMQLAEWKGLAEQRGFLVVAPELTAASALTPKAPQQIERQLDDDRAILSIVRTVRGAYAIDETRVFITGWSAGNYVTLFTGLRHPDIFRAISCRQGNFRPEFVAPVIPFLDPNQAIQVTFGELDTLKESSEKCIDWLHEHDMDPNPDRSFGGHRRDPDPVFSFFAWVVRNRPWVRVEVGENPTDDMSVTLRVQASFEPTRYYWDFGDGETISDATPAHRYAKPGQYTVQVALWGGGQKRIVRHVQLQIPRVRLGGTTPAR